MEVTALRGILTITVAIMAFSGATCSPSCVENLPQFNLTTATSSNTTNLLQTIIPAYTFNCQGSVVEWGACVEVAQSCRNGTARQSNQLHILFQVWRPRVQSSVPEANLTLDFVGENLIILSIEGVLSAVCGRQTIAQGQRISVMPNDVVGFYAIGDSHSSSFINTATSGVNVVAYTSNSEGRVEREVVQLSMFSVNEEVPVITATIEEGLTDQGESSRGSAIAAPLTIMFLLLVGLIALATAVLIAKYHNRCKYYIGKTVRTTERRRAHERAGGTLSEQDQMRHRHLPTINESVQDGVRDGETTVSYTVAATYEELSGQGEGAQGVSRMERDDAHSLNDKPTVNIIERGVDRPIVTFSNFIPTMTTNDCYGSRASIPDGTDTDSRDFSNLDRKEGNSNTTARSFTHGVPTNANTAYCSEDIGASQHGTTAPNGTQQMSGGQELSESGLYSVGEYESGEVGMGDTPEVKPDSTHFAPTNIASSRHGTTAPNHTQQTSGDQELSESKHYSVGVYEHVGEGVADATEMTPGGAHFPSTHTPGSSGVSLVVPSSQLGSTIKENSAYGSLPALRKTPNGTTSNARGSSSPVTRDRNVAAGNFRRGDVINSNSAYSSGTYPLARQHEVKPVRVQKTSRSYHGQHTTVNTAIHGIGAQELPNKGTAVSSEMLTSDRYDYVSEWLTEDSAPLGLHPLHSDMRRQDDSQTRLAVSGKGPQGQLQESDSHEWWDPAESHRHQSTPQLSASSSSHRTNDAHEQEIYDDIVVYTSVESPQEGAPDHIGGTPQEGVPDYEEIIVHTT